MSSQTIWLRKSKHFFAYVALAAILVGCSRSDDIAQPTNVRQQEDGFQQSENSRQRQVTQASNDDIFDIDDEAERKYCLAAAPFCRAFAARDYGKAYELADPLTFANMHAIQLPRKSASQELRGGNIYYDVDPADRVGHVDKATFIETLKSDERFGTPIELEALYVEGMYETEPVANRMFHCPSDYAFEKIKALITADFVLELSELARQNVANEYNVDVDNISKYEKLTMKILIIESNSKLKVGYFQINDVRTRN